VAVFAAAEEASRPLLSVLTQAGAVFSRRDGHPTVIHYGSPAGELAVCVSAAGLVDRSALSKLVVHAPAAQLSQLTLRLAGGTLAPGGALHAAGAWWCAMAADRIVVLSEPGIAVRLQARVRDHAVRCAALTVDDRSSDWAAFELVGRTAAPVLKALGAYGRSGDPRDVPPFTAASVAGADGHWLLESDRRALLLVPAESAADVWRAIERTGRPFGISCVGLEAASRYALLERGAARTRPGS